jgi:beta-lactam-binding protein with PASTA domain
MLGDSVRRRSGGRSRAAPARPRIAGGWARWLPIAAAALVLPFVIGWAIATFLIFPPGDPAGLDGVAVPSLLGRTAEDAQRELVGASLGSLETWQLPHPTRPPGTIIAQNPLPGQWLRPGAPVQVAISTGRPRGVVPDLAGFQADRAEALLTRLGFGTRRRAEPSDAPADRVLRLEPAPGSEHELPATITLVVSEGPPEPEPLPAPDTLPGLPALPGGGR